MLAQILKCVKMKLLVFIVFLSTNCFDELVTNEEVFSNYTCI